jgi:hypothetical protein
MSRFPLPPFPCFCFAVFVLCIPMSYEFGARDSAAHSSHPILRAMPPPAPGLTRVEADVRLAPLPSAGDASASHEALEHGGHVRFARVSFPPTHADSTSASRRVQVQ